MGGMALAAGGPLGHGDGGGIVVALGQAPAGLAGYLGFAERTHANFEGIVEALRTHDEVVLVTAYPIAVRALARALVDKREDPAVVAVDATLSFVTVLAGAHHGANRLARLVATHLGATAVVTTVSDLTHSVALDGLPGLRARSVPPALQRRLNEGAVIEWVAPLVELPDYLQELALDEWGAVRGERDSVRIVVSDRVADNDLGELRMAPPTLVAGIGTSSDARTDEVRAQLQAVLEAADLDPLAVAEIATIDRRAHHPALIGLGLPVRAWSAGELAAIPVPNPSEQVRAAVDTPSVAEAAALAAAGPTGSLVVTKQRFARATIAIARRARLRGRRRNMKKK
jgi:cobalt-precorrin 5A hydrolase/precorrin-3B C17-methyltransferase